MGKIIQFFLIAVCVFVNIAEVRADPIGTKTNQYFTARWVYAVATDCDKVCGSVGLSAESMTLSTASTSKHFICRKPVGNTAFGQQHSGNCMIVDGGTPKKIVRYECLCVRSGCIVPGKTHALPILKELKKP